MSAAVLIRQDTLDELVLDGLIEARPDYPATLTESPLPRRDVVNDHIFIGATTVQCEATFGARPADPRVTTRGAERYAEVLEWLTACRAEGALCTLVRPERADLVDLIPLSWGEVQTRVDALVLSLTLRSVRLATTESVVLASSAPAVGVPATDVLADSATGPSGETAAGSAETVDTGSRSTSLLVSIGNSLGVL